MKGRLLYVLLLTFAGSGAMAQNNTSTGTNAGNGSGAAGGLENASFGYNAGDLIPNLPQACSLWLKCLQFSTEALLNIYTNQTLSFRGW